ncbi:protein kinase domain-containing protein [Streptomyces sp. WMMC897]|uniref:serine/threonine-protein kinase n=1 Tax=Streptomyces sp. WMMC897 TaxID=3014782 RepID=UPI0022B6257F|nr:serine/threonine-protein kinase [Streptomyces sp. WMMC897]MCZ7417614.1 protein kinase [Streptomyces sp. WMMC897]
MFGELHGRSPRQVGPYRLLARLGAGGMGEVYLGMDTRPSPAGGEPHLVAVKTIRAELSDDPAFRDRFRREMATAREVKGRATARLLAGQADVAEPWMATEYVAGPTLERAVRTAGPLPVEAVRHLGLGLARALRGIHYARVQHRDLKPANVLLGAEGPKVIDFGVARAFGASTLTATGALVGSPGYMSPEHVLGGRHVVAASDVFCLASVLCFAATGENPFGDGPVAGVLYRISQADADLASVPAEVRSLIEDCLVTDPSSRPDAAELDARFGAAVGSPDGPAVWPPAVRAMVTAHQDELARAVAAAGPTGGAVPTMPGASPVHSAPTISGPPPRPLAPPSAPVRRRRRGTLAAVLAGALVVGVLGVVELWPTKDGEPPEHSAKPGASPSPSRGAEPTAGVDRYGAELTRYFPVDPGARPESWTPWSTKLTERPRRCALNSEFLVCRTLNGGLEAVRAADGRPLWKAPSAAPEASPGLSGSRGLQLPGNPSGPVIHGDTVVSAEGETVRGRAADDGAVRWERPLAAEGAGQVVGDLLLGDGVVLVTADGERATAHAFDAVTGEPLWTRQLATSERPATAFGVFVGESFVAGRFVAVTEGGLTAFEARGGEPTHLAVPGEGDCRAVRAHGGGVLCDVDGGRTLTLDAVTLEPVATGVPDDGAVVVPAEGVIAAGAGEYSLERDRTKFVLTALAGTASPGTPRTVGVFPTRLEDVGEGPADGGPDGYVHSEATIVGATALFVDNRYLYTLPLEGGERGRTEIEGAPGNRAGGGVNGDVDAYVWGPELLSVGGVLFIAYHDGTVRSVQLPA